MTLLRALNHAISSLLSSPSHTVTYKNSAAELLFFILLFDYTLFLSAYACNGVLFVLFFSLMVGCKKRVCLKDILKLIIVCSIKDLLTVTQHSIFCVNSLIWTHCDHYLAM